jgi:hypothetical protein
MNHFRPLTGIPCGLLSLHVCSSAFRIHLNTFEAPAYNAVGIWEGNNARSTLRLPVNSDPYLYANNDQSYVLASS